MIYQKQIFSRPLPNQLEDLVRKDLIHKKDWMEKKKKPCSIPRNKCFKKFEILLEKKCYESLMTGRK